MEKGFQLPNGHLLSLNPRPRNSRPKRPPAAAGYSKIPQNRELSNESKGKEVRSSSTEPRTILETSPPTNQSTKLPMPKSFQDNGEGRRKDPDASPGDRLYPKSDTDASPAAPESSSAKSANTDRELYLRKVRSTPYKDSPLALKSKGKQEVYSQGAYRKVMSFANDPRNDMAKNRLKLGEVNASDTKLPMPGAIPGAGIPSPKDRNRSASGGLTRSPAVHHPPNLKRGQQQQQQQQNEEQYNDSSSQKSSTRTNNTTDSSINSHPSVSSISGPSSSATEWEDKFVVNMPSTKDSNPPTMTARQISEFRQSIERVQRNGGALVDPGTSPSPRTTTPEDKIASTETSEKKSNGNEGNDSETTPISSNDDQAAKQRPNNGRYYSPDEIGKQRFSTIWEESPSKTKKNDNDTNSDGSFLGCKEINGPEEKNPDEILYFSTTTERPKVVDVSAPISRKPRAKGKPTGRRTTVAFDEKSILQNEWRSLSDNLKHGQISRPSPRTFCQEPTCQPQGESQTPPKTAGKENAQTSSNSTTPGSKGRQKEDDVVMNTPTISHAPATPEGMRAPGQKPPNTQIPQPNAQNKGDTTPARHKTSQAKSSPSGLRPNPNSWEKANDKSKESPTGPAKPPPILTTIPIIRSRGQPAERTPESPRGVRGFMRIPGIVKSSTENLAESMRNNLPRTQSALVSNKGNTAPARSVPGPSQIAPTPSPRDMSPVSAITKDESRDTVADTLSPRVVEVAELDGHQLHNETTKMPRSITTTATSTTTHPHSDEDDDSLFSPTNQDAVYPLTLSLVFDILILSITYIQRLSSELLGNEYPQLLFGSILKMIEHCIHTTRRISLAFSTYRATGSWPKPNDKDLGRWLTEVGQAVVYLVALGFMMIIIGRAAGYVVVVGCWVVWLAKPFGWAFGLMARALVP